MLSKSLGVDIGGEWSPRQADAVMRIVEPELAEMGMCIQRLDVTCFGHTGQRVILQPFCDRHDVPVGHDSACDLCIAESK